MLRPGLEVGKVYLCRQHVDMRKSINGLSMLVETVLAKDPFSGHLFVFCNKRRDKLKMLYWEVNGFVLWYKRLEKQRFKWPKNIEDETVTLTGKELNWLLDGYDISLLKPHKKLHFSTVI